MPPTPPSPAAVSHLKPTNLSGLAFATLALALSVTGVWLSVNTAWGWLLGQVVLAVSLVQWFALLHECGHGTLFRNRRLNVGAGHVAGFFAMIPYSVWIHVHGQHHKWTGWQDLDPTTSTLTPRERPVVQRRIVNFCWKYWIPLFSVVYRVQNFWHLPRLLKVREREGRRRIITSAVALAAIYAVLVWWAGPFQLARAAGLALVLALVIEDLLILSQHTHIPMGLSHGQTVKPHRAIDQERFSRSLRLPRLVSGLVLHLDAHELHHMYPFVPGYRLNEIAYAPVNEVEWWRWVPAARALPGEMLLFHNQHETGFDL